jgi:hypothetical protein
MCTGESNRAEICDHTDRLLATIYPRSEGKSLRFIGGAQFVDDDTVLISNGETLQDFDFHGEIWHRRSGGPASFAE